MVNSFFRRLSGILIRPISSQRLKLQTFCQPKIAYQHHARRLPLALHVFLTITWALGAPVHCQDTQQDQPAGTQFSEADAPPVRRIVFFNSGIAQVLHQGEITDNQRVEIGFDRDQIDDVLKSLVFDDRSGTVESVQYQPAPGKEAIAADRIGPPMTLAQTLQKYRGESITLTLDDKEIVGSILGIETRTQKESTDEIIVLVTPTGLQTHSLTDLQSVKFNAKSIDEEFRLAMTGLANSRNAERKSLTMFFEGDGERKIQFGYVVDAPVWRMTYRLDLSSRESTLQGWAHIDNVTGFDWENVYIDLRSGRPQAFSVDLFLPLIAERSSRDRSVFGIPDDLDASPYFGLRGRQTLLSQGRSLGGMGGGGFGGGGLGGGGGVFGGGGGTFGGPAPTAAPEPMAIGNGFKVAAEQGRVARMLQFKIEKPVNLASGRSAMLPIMTQKVETELITLFDLSEKKPTAQLTIKMTNGKTFSIVAGPTTIYQDGNFVGDAELGRTDIDQETMLAYGEDQPLSLEVASTSTKKIYKKVRITSKNGAASIMLDAVNRKTQSFVFKNKDISKRSVQLNLPVGNSVAIPKPAKLENSIAQFEFNVPADKEVSKNISVDTAIVETLLLAKVSLQMLEDWKKQRLSIEPAAEKAINRYLAADKQVKAASKEVSRLNDELRENEAEQVRLTGIIEAVKSEAAATPFVEKLTALDAKLVDLRVAKNAASDKLEDARDDLVKAAANQLGD